MEITTKALDDSHRQECIWVEAGAMPNLCYINDTWDLFVHKNKGDLTGVFVDSKLAGIGKFTHLYDSYGWLETLRVHPDYQKKGLGKVIYARFVEEMEEKGLTAIGMYTNVENAQSRGLAEKHGLTYKERFSEYLKPVNKTNGDLSSFTVVSIEDGEYLLSPHYTEMGEFVVINRTFYPVKKGLGTCFAAEGWLYHDGKGNIICAGERFQPEKALHIPYFHGDTEKILQFANAVGAQRNAANLSALRVFSDDKNRQQMLENGFREDGDDYITMWRGL